MECRYCQAFNGEDDHRCRRCGRRVRMTPAYTGSSAAAPALQFEAPERASAPRAAVATEPAPSVERKQITYQPSLFTSRELPRVVPFETIAPGSVELPPRRTTPSTHRPRHRKMVAGQQSLEFASGTRTRLSDGAIYCDAPVAISTHRAIAAALDGGIIVLAIGLFAVIFNLSGGQLILSAKTAPMFLGVVAGVVGFYKFLWSLANGDTPGMRSARLMLVDFDGKPPTRAQRLLRAGSGLLSLGAGGLGLLWVFVDEETLTWHDHISKTFPTPY
jgi:uncharacterized RDD family membrane protein YckC